MGELLDALGVERPTTRAAVAVGIWLSFASAMVGVAAGQALLERRAGLGPLGVALVVVAVWVAWTGWHSVLFERHRREYLSRYPMPYRRAFGRHIFPGITIGFSQMLRPAWNGVHVGADGRPLPLPGDGLESATLVAVAAVIGLGALLLFANAWRTLGAARVGFVSEFVRPESFSPLRSGPYRRVRHPLFWSGIGVCWALALLYGTSAAYGVAVVNTLYGILYNRLEDRRLMRTFGDRYGDYAREVPRILPLRGGGLTVRPGASRRR